MYILTIINNSYTHWLCIYSHVYELSYIEHKYIIINNTM